LNVGKLLPRELGTCERVKARFYGGASLSPFPFAAESSPCMRSSFGLVQRASEIEGERGRWGESEREREIAS